jgi:hypothetical protein
MVDLIERAERAAKLAAAYHQERAGVGIGREFHARALALLAETVPALCAALRTSQKEAASLADQDIDMCHDMLTAAGIAAGALAERVEDLVEERDAAEERAVAERRLREQAEASLRALGVEP